MNGIHTPIPWPAIALWAVLAIALVVLRHAGLQAALSRRTCWSITALRVTALALVALLLLQPYREDRRPDRDAFRTVMLLDSSASMAVQDLAGGQSRLEVVRSAIGSTAGAGPTLFGRLSETCSMEARAFAEAGRAVRPGGPLPVAPGRTALGEVLAETLDETAGPPLGAVLVVSDGHSNQGRSPTEVGKLFRARGIPVSCIGVGENRQPGDLRVRFAAGQVKGRKGEPLTLDVVLENRFGHAVTTRLTVTDGQGVAAEREVTVAAGASQRESVAVTPWRAGFLSYSARLAAVPDDHQPDTDVDFAGVEVSEPDRFGILYIGAHLGSEYRFLRLLCDTHPQLSLAAAIQTGKASFYQTGLSTGEEGRLNGLPTDPDVINRFDAVVLDTRAVGALGSKGLEALVGFVDRRGGGLLALGPTADLPEALRDLLPVPPVPAGSLGTRERLETNPDFIFEKDPGQVLAGGSGLPLPIGGPLWLTSALKRGARAAAVVRGSDLAAVSAQSYGSGRVAYLGVESTWQWRLASAAGENSHTAFWNGLLVWLASTGKPRLQMPADGAKVGLGEPVALDVNVLGRDFLPAPDARITATITSPSGAARDLALDASADTPGRYTALFFPEEAGEHRVAYRIAASSGDCAGEAHFLARRTGVETEDTTYREDVLRDLARLTGGTFLSYRDLGALERLPLSTTVPMKTARLYWTRHSALLVALAAVLGAEWLLRRRFGLK